MTSDASPNGKPLSDEAFGAEAAPSEATINGKRLDDLSDEEFEAELLTLPIKYNENGEETLHGMTYEEVCALQRKPTAEDIAWAEGIAAEYLAAQK